MPWSHVSLDQNHVQRFFNHLTVVIAVSVVVIAFGVDDFTDSRSSDQDQDPDRDDVRSVHLSNEMGFQEESEDSITKQGGRVGGSTK